MALCNALRLERLHRISLQRLILGLFFSTTASVVSNVNSQFDVVAKRKLFIDRSLLVEHWFCTHAERNVLIGARKSGKSTNLSMMKQFFAASVDENGRVLEPNETKHYALFKNLKIGQRPFFEQNFARYPVIHINLADFVVTGSESDFKQSFCKVIHGVLAEHKYLFRNTGKHNDTGLKSYSDAETCHKKDITLLTHFGTQLIWDFIMCVHFKTRVLVLIDEIDAPAMSILNSNVTSVSKDFIREVFHFVTDMIELHQQDIWGSFVTGATTQGTFLGDKHMWHCYAFDDHLKYFYGVTEDEVRRLLSLSGTPVSATLMQALRNMYGGYGATYKNKKDFVFNTQSILRFCEGKVIKPYWDAAPGIAPFKKLLLTKETSFSLEKALYSELSIQAISGPSAEDVVGLKQFLSGRLERLPLHSRWSMEGYLWASGFFTSCPIESISPIAYSWPVTVPNDENRLILLDLVLNKDYYMAKHDVNETLVHSFVISVSGLSTNETSFIRLADCIAKLFVKGTERLENEAVLRYPLYNYLRQADAGLFSEVTAELGRKKRRKSDIIVTLKDGSKVFMGLTLNKESGLDALKQVLEDEQLQEFSKLKTSKCICVGINLQLLKSRCDVSYLFGSVSVTQMQNVSRSYPSN